MKVISHAQSYGKGIICYSNICPVLGIYTYFDSNGKIRKKEVLMSDIIKRNGQERENDFLLEAEPEILIRQIFFMVTAILFIITNSYIFPFIYCFLVVNGTVNAYEVFFKMIRQFKGRDGSKNELAKIHAAEHMVISAYQAKQDIPLPDDVKKQSRFSVDCGTLKFFNKVFVDTALAILLFSLYYLSVIFTQEIDSVVLLMFSIAVVVIITVIVAFILKILKKYGLLRFMEVFATKKPTSREINLAIEAVKNFEAFEQQILDEHREFTGAYRIVFVVDGNVIE